MTSYLFPSAAPATSIAHDDPHLEISVTPTASAFYAGESFSVVITFRNTREPPLYSTISNSVPLTADVQTATSAPRQLPQGDLIEPGKSLPRRLHQIGQGLKSHQEENAEAGPSRLPARLKLASPASISNAGFLYSPGANPMYRAPGWPRHDLEGTSPIRSPEGWNRNGNDVGSSARENGHSRRTRSLALGKAGMSPQELVWALSEDQAPPPLPTRRPQQPGIPKSHPHSRKVSVNSFPVSPPVNTSVLPSPSLPPISETQDSSSNRPLASRTTTGSSSGLSSTSGSRLDLNDSSMSRSSSEMPTPRRMGMPPRSPSSPLSHSRVPSYHNSYGASLLGVGMNGTQPPPRHPSQSSLKPVEPYGTTTILWAHTRLVAHFSPSNTYIPPDPLLPLRSMLLHQPVGSGTLTSPSAIPSTNGSSNSSSSRWQLSFGTGTIGQSTQPSLTGSLFGLAKSVVYGGAGGSLEEERKRVWNMKDLPVLETSRSLLGVDIRLKEGESKEYVYTLQLPTSLPPAHKGKAFRFSYNLVISLNVALPGVGRKQRTKDITVPIRVWANVSLANPLRSYDVLKPIIQTRDEGKVTEQETTSIATPDSLVKKRTSVVDRVRPKGEDTLSSLQDYAKHLLDTLPEPPSEPTISLEGNETHPEDRMGTPRTPGPPDSPSKPSANLSVPSSMKSTKGLRPRKGSFVEGDDELVEEGGEGCGEAVEILSRHSPKTSYDISKDGELVAVLTLIKTTYRLGETVLGVVTFNETYSERRVLKLSAYLESHELIPENLLPPSPSSSGPSKQPPLSRIHAEHRSAYVHQTSKISFALDIPSDGTPAFSLSAGETETHGKKGGLEWKLRLSFLVACPPPGRGRRFNRRHGHRIRKSGSISSLNGSDGFRSDDSGSSIGSAVSGNNGFGENDTEEKRRRMRRIRKRETVGHSLIPLEGNGVDTDNDLFTASTTLTPLLTVHAESFIPDEKRPNGQLRQSTSSRSNSITKSTSKKTLNHQRQISQPIVRDVRASLVDKKDREIERQIGWLEMKLETVECEVPVKVLAGNTAFVVRPLVYIV